MSPQVRSGDVEFLPVLAVGAAVYPPAVMSSARLVEDACQRLIALPASTDDLATGQFASGTVQAEQATSAVQQSLAAVEQQLDSALFTLAAISNISADSSVVAPLLLLTEAQATVLQPLLEAAGLADSSTAVTRDSSEQPDVVPAPVGPGDGGCPPATETQGQFPTAGSGMTPARPPLKLLRVSTDVLQLLLRHHPHVQQQLPDLTWGRDLAPYYTLPGLFGRIDDLLRRTCGLRLLPAGQEAASTSPAAHQPPPLAPSAGCEAGGLQSVAEFGQQQQFTRPTGSSCATGGDGDNQWQQQQQQEPPSPLMLPGPQALQALLHELGHALSYLCPFFASTLQLQQQQGGDGSSSNVYSLCLLSGPAPGVDIRELSSHLFEHWCRAPQSLMVLSCHERLGVPLPQRTALQVPQLMAAVTAAGSGSSMQLHDSVLYAMADLQLHGCWGRLRAPAGWAVLADVEDAAAAGPVGGVKAAYVMAKLLSAAAWKSLGLEEQPVGGWSPASAATADEAHDEHVGCGSSSSSRARKSRHRRAGGAEVKDVLLRSGCFQPGHHTVMQLLGGDAGVLVPVKGQGVDGSDAGRAVVEGWVPDLLHEVYQDVELV
eukprot:gene11698-11842_t